MGTHTALLRRSNLKRTEIDPNGLPGEGLFCENWSQNRTLFAAGVVVNVTVRTEGDKTWKPFLPAFRLLPVIEMMEAWRKERKSFAEIASGLNAEGVPMNPHQCHLSDASSVEESYS